MASCSWLVALQTWPSRAFYEPRSLMLLGLDNGLRRLSIRAIEWVWWDRVVLLCIGLNSLQLAMYDPFDTPEFLPDHDNILSGEIAGGSVPVSFLPMAHAI